MKALRTLLSYRPRLLERVALALALVGLAPLGFLAWRLIGITESSLTEQLLRSQAVAARTAAERADAFLSLRRSLAEALSVKVERSPLPADQVLLSELEALDAIGVLGAALVDAAGAERVRVQLRGASARGVERFAHELRDAGAPALLSGDPPHLLLESKPGERGAVRMLFDATPLADTLATAEMGRQADLVLVDARRRRLLGPQSGIEGFPDDFLEAATSGRVVQAARRLVDPSGRSFLGAAAPLSTVPWAIVSRQPTAIAEETVRRMNRAAFASLSGALSLIAGLGFLAYRGLVQPIRALAEAQRRVAHAAPGDPEQPAGDELRQLTSAFRVLEERLRDREAFDRVFLGRYQVVEILGGGAMGTLFRGWDPRLDRPVAIKTVRFAETDPMQRQQLQQRLLKEAVTTARFSHPNIVSVYDALDAPQGAFVVMEFVDGSSLARLLRDQVRLAPDQVAILGHAVAAGLAAAHERGVVHRDVTPGNVFLGRAGAIKLGDFGIAEIQALAAPRSGRVFGTPGFIPPEACVGEPFVPAGDVFSLGVLLYLCLTGTHPFLAGGVQQTMLRTVAAEFERPRKLQPAVPAELDDLVVRAMSKHAGQRPRAAELALGLESLCDALGGVWRMGHLLPQGAEVPEVAAGSTRQWSQTVSTRPARRD